MTSNQKLLNESIGMENHINYEIKLKCQISPVRMDSIVKSSIGADSFKEMIQIDTYYECKDKLKMMKLRITEPHVQGEENLICFERSSNESGSRESIVERYSIGEEGKSNISMKAAQMILANLKSIGQVSKKRKIIRSGNVKIHIDSEIKGIGLREGECFLEVEVIGRKEEGNDLKLQCESIWKLLVGYYPHEIINKSYFDLVIQQK